MKYWVFKHTYPNATEDEHYDLINTCLNNNFCYFHYEYGLIKNTSRVWNVVKNIKIGDVIFLFDNYNLYAYGYAKSPRKLKNSNKIFLNCNSIINNKNHEVNGTVYRHDKINDIYVYFEDCECFYENLYDDDTIPYEWKQRIDVNWEYINKDNDGDFYGIWNGPISGAQGVFIPIIEINKEYAKQLAIKLTQNENFQFKEDTMEDYKKLLESNYNLILTGAPGTGKTYLAKQIAAKIIFNDNNKEYTEELEDDENFKNQCKFVQFHPSYDYTDFVEGLRPIKDSDGKISFERKDGVFKDFCKKALENLIEIESITIKEYLITFANEMYNDFKKDNKITLEGISGKSVAPFTNIEFDEKKEILSMKAESQGEYTISGNINEYVDWYKLYKKLQQNETSIKGMMEDKIPKFKGKGSYLCAILNNFYEKYNSEIEKEVNNKKKNFVFIIDEINRGEISKIFGELFFAIDPGYRGIKGKVITQYSNLIDKESEKYFYIPENVYIIGTMNDIDRSVESMDFAMRRRFAWKEVDAKYTQEDILKSLDSNIKQNAIDVMNALNNAISEIESFNSSYHIGASYFLKLKNYYNGGNIEEAFNNLWENHLKGLLYEYLRGMPDAENKLEELKNVYNSGCDNNTQSDSNTSQDSDNSNRNQQNDIN
ncbi:McrB family protein [Brachyspira intermedia]|uniref:McrB family protein n=1 Tax=Brachyspira intermedia TaxID=84377 RepID=UPI00300692E8